jgi:hypothetical protein
MFYSLNDIKRHELQRTLTGINLLLCAVVVLCWCSAGILKLKIINMDSITHNKLEYITSGSGLSTEELNEIVDLMDSYAREHVTEALRQHVVVRGGDSENQFVNHVNKYFKVAYLDKT